jgi:hypothetical protein
MEQRLHRLLCRLPIVSMFERVGQSDREAAAKKVCSSNERLDKNVEGGCTLKPVSSLSTYETRTSHGKQRMQIYQPARTER